MRFPHLLPSTNEILDALIASHHFENLFFDEIKKVAHADFDKHGEADWGGDTYEDFGGRWYDWPALADKAIEKDPKLKTLYHNLENEDDMWEAFDPKKPSLDAIMGAVIPVKKAYEEYSDIISDLVSDRRDRDDEERNPYSSRGLSRGDFYPRRHAASLEQAVLKLATQQPSLRAHLLPLVALTPKKAGTYHEISDGHVDIEQALVKSLKGYKPKSVKLGEKFSAYGHPKDATVALTYTAEDKDGDELEGEIRLVCHVYAHGIEWDWSIVPA